QKPFVAKILTVLSQAGLETGSPGPGGGYALARHPREILINDVFRLFERENESDACPFGGGICGRGDPCPLHDRLVDIQASMNTLLHDTTFEVFRKAYQEDGRRPAKPTGGSKAKKRESFRAPK